MTESLRSLIERRLQAAQQQQDDRYWYPLCRPTYGADEVMAGLSRVLDLRTTMGECTAQFEETFAAYVGAEHAVMVNSGSSAALLLAFMLANPAAARLSKGDEILVPAVTWPTQVWSCIMAGFKVRLVDVDPATLNISLADLDAKIGPRSRAVFPVHVLGNPCDMGALREIARKNDLILLEDACEALGATCKAQRVGSFGLGSVFSFFFSHHITTMEGGMCVTSDSGLAEHLRVLRSHGWSRAMREPKTARATDVDPRYSFVSWGFNVRPTEVQAAFGQVQLERLEDFNERRRELGRRFYDFLSRTLHLSGPLVMADSVPSWMSLPVLVAPEAPFTRAELTRHLEEQGVETRPIITGNFARQPAAELLGLDGGDLPGADSVHDQGFYVGVSPTVSDGEMSRLLETFDSFLGPECPKPG